MIPVHVVTGFLGAGKTTLLLDRLARHADRERAAVVVNDFGEARFDATLLGGRARVRDIAGGCVCCTAPRDLAPALRALLDEVAPDRIFIEATGLARPADLVDTLRRAFPGGEIAIMPVVAVVDPARFAAGEDGGLQREQLGAADVLVVSRRPDAPPEAEAALRAFAEDRYPPLLGVFEMTPEGGAPDAVFEAAPTGPRPLRAQRAAPSTSGWATASASPTPERSG